EAVARLLVVHSNDARPLTVTCTWRKTRVVEYAMQHAARQRCAGELARGEGGAHHVVEIHKVPFSSMRGTDGESLRGSQRRGSRGLTWIHRFGSGLKCVVTPKCPVVVEE